MCRHLVYLGPPATLEALLLRPEHGLLRQSWAPRMQTHGLLNADGFGVGWYDDRRAEPALYRRAQPMWTDASFASIAGVIDARAVLASVRSATPGFPVDESSTQPFASERWLFAHNGLVEGFNQGVGVELRARLSPRRASQIRSASDSEVLFMMALDRLDAGEPPATSLVEVLTTIKQVSGGRLNLLLTDGERVAATVFGNSLFARADDTLVVASEPDDDEAGWQTIPDLSVLDADRTDLTIRPL